MTLEGDADFVVRTATKTYRIWADGRTEGFTDEPGPVVVFNRIPRRIAKEVAAALQAVSPECGLYGDGA